MDTHTQGQNITVGHYAKVARQKEQDVTSLGCVHQDSTPTSGTNHDKAGTQGRGC